MIEDPRGTITAIVNSLNEMRVSLDIANLEVEIGKLHQSTLAEKFWDENQEAQKVLKQISDMQSTVDKFKGFWEEAQYIKDMLDMAESEGETEIYRETVKDLERFAKRFEEYELLILFSGENDKGNAIVSMHAGAGGTEAQDWVEMLLRMYTRWAEASGYDVEIMDFLAGDEAGVKSVTFMASGLYAYGKLKCEEGVHRLIRISPFDSSGRRHTSFASVAVLPEITDDIAVDINPRICALIPTAGAPGSARKQDRLGRAHYPPPDRVVAQCQNERSQYSNRLAAMKILTARLYELKQKNARIACRKSRENIRDRLGKSDSHLHHQPFFVSQRPPHQYGSWQCSGCAGR